MGFGAKKKPKPALQQLKFSNPVDAARGVTDALKKRYGKESALVLGDGGSIAEVTEVIPFGISPVDRHAFGIGGLPVGRVSEGYGGEGTGKSSMVARFCAQAQKGGGIAVVAENENALQPSWWQDVHDVDLDRLIIIQADTIEQTTSQMFDAMSALPAGLDGPSFFAWDTLASTPTRREIDYGLSGDDKVGDRARALSKMMRAFTRLIPRRRCHLMIVNQIRDNIGVLFGDKTTTPGGHAVKFHSSIRFQILGGKKVIGGKVQREEDEDDEDADSEDSSIVDHAGKDVTLICTKNKLSIPWRKARLRLDYHKGWSEEFATLYHAKEAGKVSKDAKGENGLAIAYRKLGWPPPNGFFGDDGEAPL